MTLGFNGVYIYIILCLRSQSAPLVLAADPDDAEFPPRELLHVALGGRHSAQHGRHTGPAGQAWSAAGRFSSFIYLNYVAIFRCSYFHI